ncbi:hypothetical protein ACLOJK_019616 [Asimina triloba]
MDGCNLGRVQPEPGPPNPLEGSTRTCFRLARTRTTRAQPGSSYKSSRVRAKGWVTAPSQHLSIAIRRQQRRRTSQAAGTSRSPAAEETHLTGTSRSPAAEETHLAGTSRSPAAEETHLSIAGSRDAPPDRLPRLRRRQQRRTSRLRIVFLASVAGSRARDAPPGSRSSSSPPSQASVFCSLAEI